MINVLPPDSKKAIKYARWNFILLRYCFLALLVPIGVVAIVLFGQYYISRSELALQESVDTSQTKVASLQSVQKEAEALSSKITTINQLFSKEMNFGDILKKIGAILPDGATLNGLELSQKTLNAPISITVNTLSHQVSAQVVANLQDPRNNLFDTADIESTTCTKTSTNGFPCQTVIRAVFKKQTTPAKGAAK